MSRKQKFRFTTKPVARGGKLSVILAIASGALMLASMILSFLFEGNGGTILGALGLCAILLAGYGFVLGIRGLNERKADHMYSFIGTVSSGLAVILWLAIFFVGLK